MLVFLYFNKNFTFLSTNVQKCVDFAISLCYFIASEVNSVLVIKMLKKATNMNNVELANYLGKTRNTITSWEDDENSIPNTEKERLSNRFQFCYDYWNVGLDKTNKFYQKMYHDIKNGCLRDLERHGLNNDSRIDEILRYCDATYEIENDNYGVSSMDYADDKHCDDFLSSIRFDDKTVEMHNTGFDIDLYVLKDWRREQAVKENIKPFQVLSDEVLENIARAYKSGNKELSGIKNFPVGGIKWNKYHKEIIDVLSEE